MLTQPDTPIRLIVADLDGTLLNSAHVLSPRTIEVVRRAMANGARFTVATGKTFPAVRLPIETFDIRLPVICHNGTAIYAPDGALLHAQPIDRALAMDAVQMALDNDMTAVVYVDHGLISHVWDANTDEIIAHHEPEPAIVDDIVEALRANYRPYKLVLMNQDEARVIAFMQKLQAAYGERALVLRTGLASVVEVLPPGVSKGTALDYILNQIGLHAHDVLCLGDSFNDIEMMQRARIGVAMANAPLAVRESADYVTASNDEDGVALAIERFVLQSETAP